MNSNQPSTKRTKGLEDVDDDVGIPVQNPRSGIGNFIVTNETIGNEETSTQQRNSWNGQQEEADEQKKRSGLSLMPASHPGAVPMTMPDQQTIESGLPNPRGDVPPRSSAMLQEDDQRKKGELSLVRASHPGASSSMDSDQVEFPPSKSFDTEKEDGSKKKSGLTLVSPSQPAAAPYGRQLLPSQIPQQASNVPPVQEQASVNVDQENQDNDAKTDHENDQGELTLVVAELVQDDDQEVVAQQVEDLLASEMELLQQERNQNQMVHQVAILEEDDDAKKGHNDHDKNSLLWGQRPSFWSVLLLIVLGTGGALAVILSGGKDSTSAAPTASPTPIPTSTPTATPNPRREYLLGVLEESVPISFSSPEGWIATLNDPQSPQGQALTWMSEEDNYSETQETVELQVLLERFALAVLYFSTDGSSWSMDFPYLDGSTSVCAWNDGSGTFGVNTFGVFCGNLETVIYMNLDELVLRGTLPWELSIVSNLQLLSLRYNLLSGSIPTQVGELSLLRRFWISQNGISGQVPPNLPASLNSLHMDDNDLSGMLATEWADSLPSLRELFLGGNRFQGAIPTVFGTGFGQLTYMDLQQNALTGNIPSELGLLSSLVILRINQNGLSGTIPSEIGRLSLLKTLALHENEGLHGTIPSEFGGLNQLDEFYFYDTSLTGSLGSIFCSNNNHKPSYLQGDCLGTTPEIECTCCDLCCMEEGDPCEYL